MANSLAMTITLMVTAMLVAALFIRYLAKLIRAVGGDERGDACNEEDEFVGVPCPKRPLYDANGNSLTPKGRHRPPITTEFPVFADRE